MEHAWDQEADAVVAAQVRRRDSVERRLREEVAVAARAVPLGGPAAADEYYARAATLRAHLAQRDYESRCHGSGGRRHAWEV